MTAAQVLYVLLGAAAGLGIVALAKMALTQPAAAKPFWMGAWPPKRGSIIDLGYRYDHLPFDWMAPGERFDLGNGELLEVLAKPGRLGSEPAEQPRRGEDVQPARRGDVHAPGVVDIRIQLVANEGAPDRDALARREPARQAHQIICVAADEAPYQSGLSQVTIRVAAGREANGLDGDLEEAAVDHAHTDAAVRVVLKASRKSAGEAGDLAVLHLTIPAVPKGDDLQPHAVAEQCPPCVDDAQHRAECGACDGQGASPVHICRPSGQAHVGISIQSPGLSIAQGGAA